jgi:2-methylcitrate dehydratase PrpD
MLGLIHQHNILATEVERVEVGGNQSNVTTLFRHRPTTGLEAKFSMEFSISILLLERKASLSQFTDAVVKRPDVQEMVERVRYYVDPEFDKRGKHGETLQSVLVEGSIVRIYMKDGRVLSGRSGSAKGSPKNPMTYDEVADKFRGNAEFARWPAQKSDSVIELVKSLESASDLSRLVAALTS